jgi:hypothetical protein
MSFEIEMYHFELKGGVEVEGFQVFVLCAYNEI